MLGLQMHHSVFIFFVLAYSEIVSLWDLQKYHGTEIFECLENGGGVLF